MENLDTPGVEVSPALGGCWYCHRLDDSLVWCGEWDCSVHVSCIKKVLAKDPHDPEAEHMKYLL